MLDQVLSDDRPEALQRPWTATNVWRRLLADLLVHGAERRQDARAHEPRSRTTRELLGWQTRWPMRSPVVLCPARRLGRRFAAAEAAWILSGTNRLDAVSRHAPHLRDFSDDGVHLYGAYGPPFVDQLPYVVSCLARDPASRQAVATLWRPRPGQSKDIPCTVALQWVVRDHEMHCVATMRSSDAWLGVPYDAISFSCMSAAVAAEVNRAAPGTVARLGELVFTAGSQHLYYRDWEASRACAGAADDPGEVAPLDLAEVHSAAGLEEHLEAVAMGLRPFKLRWLAELAPI